jgi:NitT/TauT family transport system ATP-binding protein
MMPSEAVATDPEATAIAAPLEARHLSKVFEGNGNQQVEAFRDISFTLRSHEILAIVGPSGCGKSTLFNVIAGLLEPTAGRVFVSGLDVAGATGHVGYMLQKDLLLPWRTVLDNVLLGLEVRRGDRAQSREHALKLISEYGLKGFENHKPSKLSGGMRQRVAFMRTLALDPDVILLDEPFSALDFQTRVLLQQEIMSIIKEREKSAILVTHDIGEAITMADRVIVMTNRPARIKTIHTIELDRDERNQITLRQNPRFNAYFQTIWSELDVIEAVP